MQGLSYRTETVLFNKITRNTIVLYFKDSPRKPLRRRPKENEGCIAFFVARWGKYNGQEADSHCLHFRMIGKANNADLAKIWKSKNILMVFSDCLWMIGLHFISVPYKLWEVHVVFVPKERVRGPSPETHPTVENLSSAFHFESGKFVAFWDGWWMHKVAVICDWFWSKMAFEMPKSV